MKTSNPSLDTKKSKERYQVALKKISRIQRKPLLLIERQPVLVLTNDDEIYGVPSCCLDFGAY